MRDKGSALLTAIIAVMVLLMISGAFFNIINYQYRLESSEEKGLRAYYLAEAGINYGIAEVKNDVKTEHDNDFKSKYDDLGVYQLDNLPANPLGSDYPGSFDVKITIDKAQVDAAFTSASYILTVESTGYYPDTQGIKRTLTEQYTFQYPGM